MAYTRLNPKTETNTPTPGVTVTRHGGICTLRLSERTLEPGWTTIGTIPTGYRPSELMTGAIIATGGSGSCGILKLETDGTLNAYNGLGSNRAFAGFLAYKLA